MAEPQENTPKSKRDTFRERMAKKRPDLNMDDEEALYGALDEDYADYDQRIAGYEQNERDLSDMFSQDARSGLLMQRWRKGDDPAIAMLELFGDDIVDAINDPDKMDEVKAARQKYLEKTAKAKQSQAEYEKNLSESLQQLEQYQQEQKLSDDEVNDLMGRYVAMMRDFVNGRFSKEQLEMVRKGAAYDADLANAEEEGRISGRNEKIRAKLQEPQGDGLPGAGGRAAPAGGRKGPDLGPALEGAAGKESDNIFARGGFKRTRAK